MNGRRRGVVLAVFIGVVTSWPAPALAHPLGNFTVNTYAGIHLVPGQARIEYVVDMAEIPTFQALAEIDSNGDGAGSPSELTSWAQGQASDLADGLSLRFGGSKVPLTITSTSAGYLPGQGGLQTLRLEASLSAPLGTEEGTFEFEDPNYAGHVGWHEVTAAGEDGVRLGSSDVPAQSISDALQSYPQDLLASPLDVTAASGSFEPGRSLTVAGPSATEAADPGRPLIDAGPFAALAGNRGLPLVALALLLAVAFGAWHALLPGHGKTLMAAYMVGSDSRPRQAIAVGSAVALMHTASVLALGLLVLTLDKTFRPEDLYPWLGLVSGLVALGLGVYLLVTRLAAWGQAKHHDRAHAEGHGHDHSVPQQSPLSRRGLMALALAGGILPAPSALIVMLGAISAHRAAFGVALVLAFSVGLATALILVGLGALRLREALGRRMTGHWVRLIPVVSAGAIVGVGVFLTARGIGQI